MQDGEAAIGASGWRWGSGGRNSGVEDGEVAEEDAAERGSCEALQPPADISAARAGDKRLRRGQIVEELDIVVYGLVVVSSRPM